MLRELMGPSVVTSPKSKKKPVPNGDASGSNAQAEAEAAAKAAADALAAEEAAAVAELEAAAQVNAWSILHKKDEERSITSNPSITHFISNKSFVFTILTHTRNSRLSISEYICCVSKKVCDNEI